MSGDARTFPAMGGSVETQIVAGPEDGLDRIQCLFEHHERTMSRFLPDSELSALNDASGYPFRASPLLFDIVNEAVGWACVTDGVFDPTIIDILEATGYDRPFDELRSPLRGARSTATAVLDAPVIARRRWRDIAFDYDRSSITLPPGVRIDLGGIGKGYSVDRAIESLGPGANAMVNASGDLYAAGDGPEGDGWYVGVQDPFDAESDIVTLNINDRGVATSGSIRRNWQHGDARYHHLIDPRTNTSAASELLTVTVIAATATQADALAKTAYCLGLSEGLRLVERFAGADCIAISGAGDVLLSSGASEHIA